MVAINKAANVPETLSFLIYGAMMAYVAHLKCSILQQRAASADAVATEQARLSHRCDILSSICTLSVRNHLVTVEGHSTFFCCRCC